MKRTIVAAAVFSTMLGVGTASAHSEHKQGSTAVQPAATAAPAPDAKGGTRDAQTYFTDLELQTQDGRKVRFYSDMLKGRTVLLNVIYTNCTDACPMITQHLNAVRRQLGEQFGKQIFFVTLTSDPERDTPRALKDFARDQSADVPGWTFLTGRKENVDHILKKLGMFSENVEGHSTLLIGGNVPAKRWSKIRPDAQAVAIAERMTLLAGAPVQAGPVPTRQ